MQPPRRLATSISREAWEAQSLRQAQSKPHLGLQALYDTHCCPPCSACSYCITMLSTLDRVMADCASNISCRISLPDRVSQSCVRQTNALPFAWGCAFIGASSLSSVRQLVHAEDVGLFPCRMMEGASLCYFSKMRRSGRPPWIT